jgi:nicotinate-nucleotide adenylyltransferase
VTGIFGGTFDPPHNGHVALVRAALEHFDLDRLVILVAEAPGHRSVHASAAARMELAEAAFPELEIELDPYGRTIDMLRARAWANPIFLVGADQLEAFSSWKEPGAVLELARLGVATRPGYATSLSEAGDRIETFAIPPVDVSSSAVRRRVAVGEPIDGLVPPAVVALIAKLGLYRH